MTTPDAFIGSELIERRFGCSPYGPKFTVTVLEQCPGCSFTHLVHEASLAGGAGGVVIQTIVRRCRDHNSIAVDVDIGRGRPSPFETRCIYSPQLFPLRL